MTFYTFITKNFSEQRRGDSSMNFNFRAELWNVYTIQKYKISVYKVVPESETGIDDFLLLH